jgi:hypothetical protein
MKSFTKVSAVLLLVCLLSGQNAVLMAQSPKAEEKVVATDGLNKATEAAPAPVAVAANLPSSQPAPAPSAPAPKPPQSSSTSRNIGLIAGLAMTGAGVAMLVANEPTHQTTCVTYGICPVPGAVHVTGGIMLGVGVPLTIFKLLKH